MTLASDHILARIRSLDADDLAAWVSAHAGQFTHAEECAIDQWLKETAPWAGRVAS